MSLRPSAPDPAAAEIARRRLSLLGADLSAGRALPARPSSDAACAPGSSAAPPAPPPVPPVSRGGRHARERLGWTSRSAARATDGMAPGLAARFHVTAQHLTVIALTLSAAMALAAWLLVRSAPEPVPPRASLQLPAAATRAGGAGVGDAAGPLTPAVAPAASVAGAVAPTTGTPETPVLLVHVSGKVRRPGVVELPAGSRVIDAIEAAGGARVGARLGLLNLARPLVDGEQVAVGVLTATPPLSTGTAVSSSTLPATADPAGGLVNLNTATQPELEELPGIGPVTATSILEWRSEHAGFSTVDELIEVSGIGEVTLAELRDLVTV